MNHNEVLALLVSEFESWKPHQTGHWQALNTGSGSNRKYFRVTAEGQSFIACYSSDLRENEAFFYLADFYGKQDLNIPEVRHISTDRTVYFQQDLGDLSLLQQVQEIGFNEKTILLYENSLQQLHQMQTQTKHLDFSKCYPRESFDKQSILWDLNYFKYYFLKVSGLEFDEQKLEDDFHWLADNLSVGEQTTFMFRDFQARNIQLHDNKVWFIDFQGGRRGPVLYDLVSLLYQASAQMPNEVKNHLSKYYFNLVNQGLGYEKTRFQSEFNQMVLIRIVQTLGAYGFRGLIEGKPYFKASIKPALINLETHLEQGIENLKIPYFMHLLEGLVKIKDKFDQ